MADGFDKLMKDIAEEANQNVDYEAMKQAILSANAKQKTERFILYRKLTIAAAFVVVVGAGALAVRVLGAPFKAAAPMAAPAMEAAGEEAYAAAEASFDAAVTAEAPAEEPAPAAMEAPQAEEPAADEPAPEEASSSGAVSGSSSGMEPRTGEKNDSQQALEDRTEAVAAAPEASASIGQSAITAEELAARLPGAWVREAGHVPDGIGSGEAVACEAEGEAAACWRLEDTRCLYITLPGVTPEALLEALDQAVNG